MVRGKKGFERIIWAFKNVFNYSLAWLFYDLKGTNDGSGPISAHAPTVKTIEPEVSELKGVTIPTFPDTISEEDGEEATELLEWVSMTMMASPRVQHRDNIDPFLCRYQTPLTGNADTAVRTDLVTYRWHGFIPSVAATRVLLAAMKASQDTWMAMTGDTFDGGAYTALKHDGKVMTWKYAD